jgi:hypothetical protein
MNKVMFLAFCIGWSVVSATSWRVNNNPAINADFATFTDAVAGVSVGDTLYIEGSLTSYGTQTFGKQLILIGPGYFLDQNDSTQAVNLNAVFDNLTIDSGAGGSMVYGLFIDNQATINANNVVFARNNVASHGYSKIILAKTNGVNNCAVIQNYSSAIGTYDNFKAAINTIISNNIVSIDIALNQYSSLIIFNNVVRNDINVWNSVIKNNIQYYSQGNGYNENTGNVFEYNLSVLPTVPSGTGNIAGIIPEDIFIDFDGTLSYSPDGKWQLKDGSLAIGHGENSVDCGAFGGLTPYVLSGLPAVPHIFEAAVPTAGSSQSGLPVTIKVKTQN